MAKDDYFVIVYQILSYLYQCLKKGEAVDPAALMPESKLFRINEGYWKYILVNMTEQGFIKGISMTRVWGGDVAIQNLEGAVITPAGIEYLCDNSMMNKVKDFIKDIRDIVPLPW